MSDNASRSTAKRQIARLVAGADYPCYVLSDTGHIVFANEAFGRLLRTDPDALIGIHCSPIATLGTTEPLWASWFSAPPNGSPHQVSIHRDTMPQAMLDWIASRDPEVTSQPGYLSSSLNGKSWVRVGMPLDDLDAPTVLYLLKEDRGDFDRVLDSVRQSHLRSIAIQGRIEHPELQSQWYLSGASVDAQRARSQIRLAANGNHPCRLIGPAGSPVYQCALWIARERLQRLLPKGTAKPEVITIECRLMDKELLADLLDMADEALRRNAKGYVLLHQLDRLAPELKEPLARKILGERWMVIATTSSEAPLGSSSTSGDWGVLAASLDTQIVTFTPICIRIADLEPLIVSWFDNHYRTQQIAIPPTWTKEFMDTILAYSWPNDCEELGETLEHASRQALVDRTTTDREQQEPALVLTEKHLPISLRTFPSHMNRPPVENTIELDVVLDQIEKELILRAMERKKNNRSAAAQLLGISRARLIRKLHQWGLGASETTSDIEDDAPIFEEVDDQDA